MIRGKQSYGEIEQGKIRIEGKGSIGWYREQRKIKYNGSDVEFMIVPKLLLEVSKRSDRCIVSDERIAVDTENFKYVSAKYCLETDRGFLC
jgi:hypothetical protein